MLIWDWPLVNFGQMNQQIVLSFKDLGSFICKDHEVDKNNIIIISISTINFIVTFISVHWIEAKNS